MLNAIPQVPAPANEPVLSYAPGSPERAELKRTLEHMSTNPIEIPLLIGGREIRTGRTADCRAPHRHELVLAKAHQAGPDEVKAAIDAARTAARSWAHTPWHERLAVF